MIWFKKSGHKNRDSTFWTPIKLLFSIEKSIHKIKSVVNTKLPIEIQKTTKISSTKLNNLNKSKSNFGSILTAYLYF